MLLLITWIQRMWLRWSRWSVHNRRGNEGSLFPLPCELKSSLLSKGRMLLNSFPERLHKHATLGQQGTFQLTWKRKTYCPDCLSNCQLTTYSTSITSTEFRWSKVDIKMYLSSSRLCDSRNLNLSPFCNLAVTSLVKWQPSIRATYGNITTSYTNGLPGPMRLKYPPSMVDKELLSSLAEVNDFSLFWPIHIQ